MLIKYKQIHHEELHNNPDYPAKKEDKSFSLKGVHDFQFLLYIWRKFFLKNRK